MFLFIFCCALAATNGEAIAQKKSKTRLKVYYEKLPSDDKKISIILTQGSGKKIVGVQNAEIFLTTYNQNVEVELTSFRTDDNGEAVLIIEANYIFPKDEKGYWTIKTMYNGNDTLRAAKKIIKFSDLNIDSSFDIIDSVKVLTVSTFEIDTIGNRKLIGGIEVNIGVERLYSTLYLQEIETNEEGIGKMEFPNDIPGDSIGAINVIIKIDDDDNYGTITKSEKVNWGTTVDYSDLLIGRSLFGDEAPLWMIISVAVILIGAWYHFMLAIFKVFRIKKMAQKSI